MQQDAVCNMYDYLRIFNGGRNLALSMLRNETPPKGQKTNETPPNLHHPNLYRITGKY